jgi:hypothetical protein
VHRKTKRIAREVVVGRLVRAHTNTDERNDEANDDCQGKNPLNLSFFFYWKHRPYIKSTRW